MMDKGSTQEKRKTSEFQDEFDFIIGNLGISLPPPYLTFLTKHRSGVFDGFSLLGIPTAAVPLSVVEAAMLFRQQRPDLPTTLIPLCLNEGKALCMDLAEGSPDPPLVEVSLEETSKPQSTGLTLKQGLHLLTRSDKRVEQGVKRLEELREENRYRLLF